MQQANTYEIDLGKWVLGYRFVIYGVLKDLPCKVQSLFHRSFRHRTFVAGLTPVGLFTEGSQHQVRFSSLDERVAGVR